MPKVKGFDKYLQKPYKTHVDLKTARIGGGAYSVSQSNSRLDFLRSAPKPVSARIEKIKNRLKAGDDSYWTFLCDMYDLTSDEYFEITKYMLRLDYPMSWVLERLRTDKLSANQYYEVCVIMATHGMFDGVDIDKLAKANPDGVKNPLYRIMMTALVESVFSQEWYNDRACHMVCRGIRKNANYFQPNEIFALYFALWVLMKPNAEQGVSCDDLAGISDKTVDYVKDIIIRKIYRSQNSDFTCRINFCSTLLDEHNGMPKSVNKACQQIIWEIHQAADKRMSKKNMGQGRKNR